MQTMHEGLRWLAAPDLDPGAWGALQVVLRALVVYAAGLVLLRIASSRRFAGKETAFDILLGFILGAVLARGINGGSSLPITLVAGTFLVGVHQTLGWLTFRSHRLGVLLKGKPDVVVRDGAIVEGCLEHHFLSRRDLEQALRLSGHVDAPDEVREARVERNGEISVIPRHGEPRIVEIRVEDGVQTVRIELH